MSWKLPRSAWSSTASKVIGRLSSGCGIPEPPWAGRRLRGHLRRPRTPCMGAYGARGKPARHPPSRPLLAPGRTQDPLRHRCSTGLHPHPRPPPSRGREKTDRHRFQELNGPSKLISALHMASGYGSLSCPSLGALAVDCGQCAGWSAARRSTVHSKYASPHAANDPGKPRSTPPNWRGN